VSRAGKTGPIKPLVGVPTPLFVSVTVFRFVERPGRIAASSRLVDAPTANTLLPLLAVGVLVARTNKLVVNGVMISISLD